MIIIVREELGRKNNRNILPPHRDDLTSNHAIFEASDIDSHLLTKCRTYCPLYFLASSFRLCIDSVATLDGTRQGTTLYGFSVNHSSSD